MTESDLNYWKATLNGVVPKHLVTPEVVALRDPTPPRRPRR